MRLRGSVLWYPLVTFLAFFFMGPFIWAVSSSFKTPAELYLYPPTLLPHSFQVGNYLRLWNELPFALFARNSLLLGLWSTVVEPLSAAAVAYGFARHRFPGRDVLFIILLSTMMLPPQVTIIPLFLLYKSLGWIDTYLPLTVPRLLGGGAFYIFLIRQFFLTLPRDLDDAAELDGASSWTIFWRVLIPLSLPALATCAIFAFLGSWNEFLQPLIYLNTPTLFTLPLGLRYFTNLPELAAEPREHLLMAASVLFSLPPVLIFFSMQRYFVQGVVMSGIKG
jgi:ABC-type glycerol-3-phosphate transport system permease component